jgi:hypothetical protein
MKFILVDYYYSIKLTCIKKVKYNLIDISMISLALFKINLN